MEENNKTLLAVHSSFRMEMENVPVNLSKVLLDILSKQENPEDCLFLYVFYLKTALWQQNLLVKAINSYTLKQLKWSKARFFRIKKVLENLGLIEKIHERAKNGTLEQHYIKIKIIFSKKDLTSVSANQTLDAEDTGCQNKSRIGLSITDFLKNKKQKNGRKSSLDIYINKSNKKSNNKNLRNKNKVNKSTEYSVLKETAKKFVRRERADAKFYFGIASRIAKNTELEKSVKVKTPQIENWADEIRKLEKELIGTPNEIRDRIDKAMEYLETTNKLQGKYAFAVYSGNAFRKKFINIEDAITRLNVAPVRPKNWANKGNLSFKKEETII